MEKAMREAQVRTSWADANEAYEGAVATFVDELLSSDSPFLHDYLPFQRRVARLGALHSLSQTLLELAVPGVPDVYQGNEIWDLSLVDLDNRPVDFEVSGDRKQNILAFVRKQGAEAAITIAPRRYAKIAPADGPLLPPQEAWKGTTIPLPDELDGVTFRNVLTGETMTSDEHDAKPSLDVARLLRAFPIALLTS